MRKVFQLFSTEFTETRDMRREVPEEATTSESTPQHPGTNNTLVDMIAGDSSAPHGMRMAQGHVLGLEKL